MIRVFRREAAKGAHSFSFQGKLYKVLDDCIIYHEDSDTVYYRDIDF